MSEDLIAPEDIKIIKPTIEVELDQNLLDIIRTFDETIPNLCLYTSGVYISPESQIKIAPDSHLIAIVPYSKESVGFRKEMVEEERNFIYQDGTRELVTELLNKEEGVLDVVFSEEIDSHELVQHNRMHEETHRIQEVRLGAANIKEHLKIISERYLNENKSDHQDCEKCVEANLELSTWAEMQAYQQSFSSKGLAEANRNLHILLILSDNVVHFTLNENKVPIARKVYETLQQGMMINLKEGVVVPPHFLAITMLLLGNPNLPIDIKEGKISYLQFREGLLDKINTLIHDPNKILEQISEPDFIRAIDKNLQNSLKSANYFLDSQNAQTGSDLLI